MRDEERIKAYYTFGTMDWFSEASGKKIRYKKGPASRVLAPLKFATLIWMEALRNISSDKK